MSWKTHSIVDHDTAAFYDEHQDVVDRHSDLAETENLASNRGISIGLEIGSSNMQIAFSEICIGHGEPRPDHHVRILFLSPLVPVPYHDKGGIDQVELWKLVAAAFEGSGLTVDDIDSGAIVLTGKAAAQLNLSELPPILAAKADYLVCVSAGYHMEAMLSAYGSGAVKASREGSGRRILLIDIGGHTTKLAVLENGQVIETATFSAGGRHVITDAQNRIQCLDGPGMLYARRAGVSWRVGETIDPTARDLLGETMANTIIGSISENISLEGVAPPLLTPPLVNTKPVDGVMIAGGVAEYVHGRRTGDVSDLGPALGAALRQKIEAGMFPYPVLPPLESVRTKVLGVFSRSLRIASDEIFISSASALLPCRNVPVVRPQIDLADPNLSTEVAAAIIRRLEAFDRNNPLLPVALAFSWSGSVDHQGIHMLAEGIVRGSANHIKHRTAFYILTAGDITSSLGRIFRDELGVASEIMVISGVEACDFDFVDIGAPLPPSDMIPVTVRSLIFAER